jgi:hypothetical protein
MKRQPKHPMQPVILDENGTPRFKENAIVRYLLDSARQANVTDLNRLALIPFSNEDREQLAQLIGYSTSGYGELSYASASSVWDADRAAEALIAAKSTRKKKRVSSAKKS